MEAWVGNEESIREAQENLTARVNDINRKSYEPFVNKIAGCHRTYRKAEDRIWPKRKRPGWPSCSTGSKRSAPRPSLRAISTRWCFPATSRSGFWRLSQPIIGLVGAFVILLAAANMAWLGVPVAKRMLPTTELVCRVINDRYGVRDCEVPAEYRRGQVPPARSGK